MQSLTELPLLTLLITLPLAGALVICCLNKSSATTMRRIALGVTMLVFLLSLPLFIQFDANSADFQFMERHDWIPALGAQYLVGVDGISLLLVMLTTFLTPIVVLSSWRAIEKNVKGFLIAILLLETGMLGVFLALDLLLFYLFWEAMLIPMYFLIGIWGGERRIYAAVKFFIYTMVGSLLMLAALIVLYVEVGRAYGTPTFEYELMREYLQPAHLQFWLFLAFGLSFAIKVPMFPLHTWLPDAHVEAPTAGSVILAGVLLKMGTYGFLRFCLPLFPDASVELAPVISVLAVVGILYGAFLAIVQKDIKKLVAYSSVSHLGFVMLGLFAFNYEGLQGGLLQMINHGLSTAGLFLLVGVIYERRHTRLIAEFGGLARQMPVFATFFLIIALSSIGLPGLNGFVGEFLILLGAAKANLILAGIATSGVIFAAVYLLWMFRRVMFGPLTNEKNKNMKDLSRREVFVFLPIVIMIIWIGVYARPFLAKTEKSVARVLETVQEVQYARAQGPQPFPGGGE